MNKSTHEPAANYTLRLNIKETANAFKKNLITVAGSILVALLLIIAVIVGFAVVAGSSLLATMRDGFDPASFGFGFVAVMLLGVVAFALISAFISILIALSVNDGADGKKTTIGSVLSRAQKHIVKVIKTEIALALIVATPLIIMTAFSLTQLTNSRSLEGFVAFGGMVFLISLTGIVWAIIALLRYCLAPIVAIFEPKLTVWQTFARSKQLMQNGGQWLVFKASALYLAILIIFSILFPSSDQSYQGYDKNDNSFVDLISSLMGIFVTGMLVMLYRNRKAVQK